MLYLALKIGISAVMIGLISEISRRVSWIGAILASLPLTSILAMVWLYRDTGSAEKVAELSRGIFWMVLPSLLFFWVFPGLLKAGFRFGWALLAACAVMSAGYAGYVWVLRKLSVEL